MAKSKLAISLALVLLCSFSTSGANQTPANTSVTATEDQPVAVDPVVPERPALAVDPAKGKSGIQALNDTLNQAAPITSLNNVTGPAGQSPQSALAAKSEQELLAELRDVYSPEAPGWWPLAPGWWAVAGLLSLLAGALLWWVPRRLQYLRDNNWKKIALIEHQRLCDLVAKKSATPVHIISQASILMRRVSLTQLPRAQVAALTDERWLEALDRLTDSNEYSRGAGQLLTRHPYMRPHDIEYASVEELLSLMRKTIAVSSKALYRPGTVTRTSGASNDTSQVVPAALTGASKSV